MANAAKTTARKASPTTNSSAKASPAKVMPAPKPTTRSAAPTAEKLRPLGDRVVLEPAPGEEMTKSGIVIPDTVKEKPQQGMVLSVGPGRILDDGKRERIDLKRGDKVLYAKYAGTEFKLDGQDLLIIGHKDILAVIER